VEAISVLTRVVKGRPNPTVAEIGTGIGATTMQLLAEMRGSGTLHLYDFAERVDELVSDLRKLEIARGVDIMPHGNSRKTFDGYDWSLATMIVGLLDSGQPLESFDFVYLDGAHAFHHDAPACALLKELIRPGGFIVFDDMYWTFAKSPVMNPERKPQIRADYTDEQLRRPHVEVVVRALMETDPRFEQIYLTESRRPYRPVFRKRTSSR
jgi:predicted O-methyltransferase YrrM